MECRSVEDYCLEKNKLLQSFRLVPVYHLFLDIVACVPLFLVVHATEGLTYCTSHANYQRVAHAQLALQISIPVPSCTGTVIPRSRCVLDLQQHVRRGRSSITKRSHRELCGQ